MNIKIMSALLIASGSITICPSQADDGPSGKDIVSREDGGATITRVTGTPVTLKEFIDEISRTQKVSILSDAYIDEPFVVRTADVHFSNAQQAIEWVASRFQREVFMFNGITILRSRNFGLAREYFRQSTLPSAWTASASLKLDAAPDNTKPGYSLPPRQVSLNADHSTFQKLFDMMSAADWQISAPPALSKLRFHAAVVNVSPGALTEGISFLLNATQKVAISQSGDQAALEAAGVTYRPGEANLCDKIRPYLDKILTDSEREQIAREEIVGISMDRIPKEALPLVNEYFDMRFKQIQAASSSPDMDFTFKEGSKKIQILPKRNSPFSIFGWELTNTSGTIIRF